jgi:hypothetical protein
MIDDSQTIAYDPMFIGHRHDQSIFSVLTKKYDIFNCDIKIGKPLVHEDRNRSGISRL